MDDISGFLDDVRDLGQEFESLKDEVVSSVVDFGRELGDEPTVAPVTSDETGES